MRFKHKFYIFIFTVIGLVILLFTVFPRGVSLIMSKDRECRVMRVEQFMKGVVMSSNSQMNKFSIACDDGSICRAEDTGFAAVKQGDLIEFRGYPEFSSFEEFGKCEHAQLKRIIEAK